jgi:Na+-driven multidrug efflux pump
VINIANKFSLGGAGLFKIFFMRIELKDHFNYYKLLRFTAPSIAMMIFTSIYGMVDGYFISNYVGEIQFAAVNLILPYVMIFGAVGMVFGTGGTALVAMKLGMGKQKQADEIFSFLVLFVVTFGILLGIIGFFTVEPVARLLGASDAMLPYCVTYGRIAMIGSAPFTLQEMFQSFMITAERPGLGFGIIFAAGVVNMILDWLFMGVLGYGVASAAIATALGECVGSLVPLGYFLSKKQDSRLHLVRAPFNGYALIRAATNGMSEFLTDISMSVVSILYNLQLMKYSGEQGVAAYGVIMYANFIFVGVYFGYSMGIEPVIGYHYGAGHKKELKNLLKRSLILIGSFMFMLVFLSEVFAGGLTNIFVGYDHKLHDFTAGAFRIYAISFVFMGFNIFASSFFTALNNGFVSAAISFLRTFIFQAACVMLLPAIFGIDGIWFSIVAAEFMALVFSIVCLIRNRKKYGY